jgi:hypothetical protein
MDVAMILAICGLAVVCAGVTVKIALGKGRNPVIWGVFGLLLSLVSLVVVTVLPANKAARMQTETMPMPEVQAAA